MLTLFRSALSDRQGTLLTLVFCRAAQVFCGASDSSSSTASGGGNSGGNGGSPKKGSAASSKKGGASSSGASGHAENLSVHLIKVIEFEYNFLN